MNRWLPPLLVALALAPALLGGQELPTPDPGVTARVDALFAAWDRDDSPGCALGVYRNGAMAYARGYGMADLERRVPISPHTVFDIGSTSKQFTAAAIVLLEQQGELSLDDDVRRWIPELPEYGRVITLRHLLHHTSGLRDYIALMTLAGTDIDDVTSEEEALAAIVRQRATNFLPGDEHLYSNSGYFLLSLVVQRASGSALRDFAREHVFAPLGMERTHYLDGYDDIVPDRALAYAPRSGGGLRADVSRWLQTGDGAVFTTVEELLLWDRNFYEPRVGGPALLDALLAPGRLAAGGPVAYSLGLVVDRYRGQPTVSHGGAWGGYRADLLRFPEQRLSVAVLCNLATTNPGLLARRVADVLLESVLEPEPVRPAAGSRGVEAVPVDVAELRTMAGTYRDPATRVVRTITFTNGALHVVLGRPYELVPVGPHTFRVADAPVEVTVEFTAGDGGAPRRLTWRQEGREALEFLEITLVEPSAAELEAYVGSYFSPELQATYTITVADGALRVRGPGGPPRVLRPMTRDEFAAEGATLRFERNALSAVTGFRLDVGRVRDLAFERGGAR